MEGINTIPIYKIQKLVHRCAISIIATIIMYYMHDSKILMFKVG